MNKEVKIELKRIADKLETLERLYREMSQRLARLEARNAPYQPVDMGKWTYNPESRYLP